VLQNSLKKKRTELELTQTELGKAVKVTRQTIAFIEKGEFAPSVTLALKLSAALNTPLTELFWLEEQPS
jgi:putative transcriptional regulator